MTDPVRNALVELLDAEQAVIDATERDLVISTWRPFLDRVKKAKQSARAALAAPVVAQPWHNPRSDALRTALRDIADTKNLTATSEQFIRHLQRTAEKALTEDAMAEPAAPVAQPATDDLPTPAMCRAAVIYANGPDIYKRVPAEVTEIEEGIYAEVWKAMQAAAPVVAQPMWVSVDTEMPASGRIVLVCYNNSNDNIRRVRAKWVKAKTAESGSESDIGEYDEESDCYYDPEGWYECIDNWDDYNAVAISDPVTHWMPLPEPPHRSKP
jgi:hypothetical protein